MSKLIVHVITTLNPNGAERLVVELLCQLKAQGFDCRLITLFKVPDGILAEKLKRAQIFHVCIGGTNWWEINLFFKLRVLLKRWNPGVIHSHLFPPEYLVPLAAPHGVPLLHTEHSVSNRRRKYPIARMVESILYQKYKFIICISSGVCCSLKSWVPGMKRKLVVVENGVDLTKFRMRTGIIDRSVFNLPVKAPVICMIGRFEMPPKDQSAIIRALEYLPDVHLVLAGAGPDHSKLVQLAKICRVEERVHFPGYIENVNELLSCIDVYIYSSFHEGFGLAVIEAMAAGIPVIASDVNALNTLVDHEVNGLLFKQGDIPGLAQSIKRVLDDERLRTRLIDNGRTTSDNYSFDKMVKKYVAIYEEQFKT